MQPVIGITPDYDSAAGRYQLHQDYAAAISAVGGYPVMLFGQGEIPLFLDGIVLSGGGDIDPLLFHEEPLRESGEISPRRDQFELSLCQAAIQKNIPLLGICRGMQVINIALGGTIYQDIGVQTKSTLKHRQQAPRDYATHSIMIEENTLLSHLWGKEKAAVNSFHHQGVALLGEGLRYSAKSQDGLIEAIEHTEKPFIFGVQWHPEAMKTGEQGRIFAAFVQAAAEFHAIRR
ncbi:putative glutamine amidotransferasec [Anaerotignum neopropionicum]|uniref:Putative glutamine amidotransferasec n=1 Tax=Anaerotignum neopropionicum TaxID=36847 RepID=A0A136WBF3_9FIRM|nr:gamma-glutamyl-gamma-aminobutyrate hydrolase family protein [Anaerotignum neopropionicum]KXL51841.1 putative glutamine amidotransferasec [Anaerotignum neopropionicum]